jgi:hypothetical protein
MITAAALCPAPPLLARELTGADPAVPELRQCCLDAVASLLAAGPDLVAVAGPAESTGTWDPGLELDLSRYAPALGARGTGEVLPVSLGLGGRLLDLAGYRGPRLLQSVAQDELAGRCAELGAGLAAAAPRVALLVMADGSARRTLKAPGYLDERSAPFDAGVEQAIAAGDLDALLTLDAGLARDLMATGRPAWQLLAGALAGQTAAVTIRYRDDPFGVAYLVASLDLPAARP